MYERQIVFSQLIEFLPQYEFRKCVECYQGNYYAKSFSCWDQFLCMSFAQLTYRESLRDIESCLRSLKNKLYHMGIRGNVSRSTLAYANEKETGASMQILLKHLFIKPKNCISTNHSAWISMKRSMRLIPQRLICVFRFFHGHNFVSTKAQ